MIAYQVSMLALFGLFFINSYVKSQQRRRLKGKGKVN